MKQLLSLYIMITSFSLVAMGDKHTVTLIAGVYKHEIMAVQTTAEKMWGVSAADNNALWYQVPVLREYRREFKNHQGPIYFGNVLYGPSEIPYCAPKSAFAKEDQEKL